MARVDATVMDRIRGLRFIHQWGAGLEGVDSPRGNGPSNRVANVRSTGGNGSGWGARLGRSLQGRTAGIV